MCPYKKYRKCALGLFTCKVKNPYYVTGGLTAANFKIRIPLKKKTSYPRRCNRFPYVRCVSIRIYALRPFRRPAAAGRRALGAAATRPPASVSALTSSPPSRGAPQWSLRRLPPRLICVRPTSASVTYP
ncbi:hypothetical protein EVAR_88071_1 [Eumeta japonica]|uniref:Uncharacterized protein n=1 Tax=Eumeta variegata TaxID=151549 RepID=A0A4C1WFM3_EUMVA|nr:hypothetical protein EVAR_88071_1 [Eumeta japonica]